MIAVVAAMGGEVERDRQTFLAGGEIAPVEGVGILRRREPGILPDGPRLRHIHGRVGAAQIGRKARPCVEEVDARDVAFAIGGLDGDMLGGDPRLPLAAAGGATSSKATLAKSGMRVIVWSFRGFPYHTCCGRSARRRHGACHTGLSMFSVQVASD